MLAGPAAGGVLVGWMGSTNALLIDAASFTLLLLVVAMSGLRRAPQEHETEETTRSDEHTSELQSLLRISYADFCLKKYNRHHPCSSLRTQSVTSPQTVRTDLA